MKRSRSGVFAQILLGVIWLAVVGGAVWLAVTQRQKYGPFAYIVPGMAVCMLTVFTLNLLLPDQSRRTWMNRLGDACVGMLILFAIVVLALGIYQRRTNLFAAIVLGVFLLVFAGIFRDWIKHFIGPAKRKR